MSLYRYYSPRPFSLLNELMNDFTRMEPLMDVQQPVLGLTGNQQVVDTSDKFAVNLNVSQFKPEDLKIDLDGRRLTIEGTEEHTDEHGHSKRSFHRSVLLPEDVDLTSIASSLTDDGKLSIEAAKKEIVKGRTIPIQQIEQQTPQVTEKPNESE